MTVFVVTYNPARWDWGRERERWERKTARDTSVLGRWSIGSRTGGITPQQDRAFLLRQGQGPRGIIGSGIFVSEAYQDDHFDETRLGDLANYADICWDRILSDEDALPLAELDAHVPGLQWRAGLQGSGVMLRPPGDDALERLWAAHLGLVPRSRSGGRAPRGPGAGQVWQDDPVRRKAVEDHGQRLLEQHYRDQGWHVQDVRHGNSFDATATKGSQVRYLEAKGTETDGRTVKVTVGEVRFAEVHRGECVLGVVSGIRFGPDGSLVEESGRLEVHNWDPSTGTLEPTGFDWTPPVTSRAPRGRRGGTA